MELIEVDASEYEKQIKPYHGFGSSSFASLNAAKVAEVSYLIFRDNRIRLGIIGGLSEGVFRSPFSAPFDGFTPTEQGVSIQSLEGSVEALEVWAGKRGINKLAITLPPPIYEETFLAKTVNVFFRRGYNIVGTELNFHFDLSQFDNDYSAMLWRNARKNLRQSLENNLQFASCSSAEEEEAAYEIIRRNRQARQKPLRMTLEQLRLTRAVIPIDFFLATTPQALPVAAAIVFHVTKRIGLVVYWGDLPEHAGLRTMNFLSFRLFEFYHNAGFHFLDIGYSTEYSVPNYGLCEFKESLGCSIQPKLIYEKKL